MYHDWDKEVECLEHVKRVIVDELSMRMDKNTDNSKKMRAINKEMWEEVGPLEGQQSLSSIPTFLQEINLLKRNLADATKINMEIKMLERQIISPYFCRIDFKENGDYLESYYIGIYGLRKAKTDEILIYDWRAPVSSIFYDYEPGPASYKCPSGYIEGELLSKRQYRIEKGKLLLMFDCTVAIDDSILQDILAGSADNKMKTIVNTIQREQNRAIRSESKRILSVQGAAGSGKTSIALHRAAYLLYSHRNIIKAGNIRLFTPNGIFAKYISNVLPELGEDDIPCDTLTGLVQSTLGDLYKKYETYIEMMEWQLLQKSTGGTDSRLESIKFKASRLFASVIENFSKVYESRIICFEDVIIDETILMTKEELTELFYKSYGYMPVAKRLSRMELSVMVNVNEYINKREQDKIKELAITTENVDDREIKVKSRLAVAKEMEMTIKKVKSMLSIDICAIYQMLFKNSEIWDSCGGSKLDEICQCSVKALENGVLLYEDQAPVLYLMILLGMVEADKKTKHVIIDEAQDYSYISYKLFSKLYLNCGITILGDTCQNISPSTGIGNLQLAGELLDSNNFEYIELDKSYRSTIEIMEFASQILTSKAAPFGRHGKVPKIMTSTTKTGVCNLIIDCINEKEGDNFNTIAIICQTLSDCQDVYRHFEKDLSLKLINSENDEINKGIALIPSYLAKGLEFDSVIAVVLSEKEYMFEEDQLFYTVCTRALHKLEVCSIERAGILEKIKS
jgi:DNA helicase II / ATP-dependent DNA helicase PcrA